jgi:hypothetical protein
MPKRTAKSSGAPSAEGTGTSSPMAAGWQGPVLDRVRALIREADPAAVEEQKWKKPTNPAGVPVWSHEGIICTGETYRSHIRLTFARGAELPDPGRFFNSGLDGNATRALVLREGDALDADAFRSMIRSAVALNVRTRG